MLLKRITFPIAFVVAIASSSIYAAEPMKFGFETYLAQPLGDLKTDSNDKLGFGWALQLAFDMGNGHMIRPRLEGAGYSVHQNTSTQNTYRDSSLQVGGIGVDYLYYLDGDVNKGAYLVGGLSAHGWQVNLLSTNSGNISQDQSHKKGSIGAIAGVGYQFKPWFGVEGRYFISEYEGIKDVTLGSANPVNANGAGVSRRAEAIQIVTTFRW